ncbi:hypothetical protein RB195_013775 [Necator americanus]|uniref:Uncharacterized protein n=1 Tax=Necator americanus TaxID=51031 RepID=A0ABR1DX38_NECAM
MNRKEKRPADNAENRAMNTDGFSDPDETSESSVFAIDQPAIINVQSFRLFRQSEQSRKVESDTKHANAAIIEGPFVIFIVITASSSHLVLNMDKQFLLCTRKQERKLPPNNEPQEQSSSCGEPREVNCVGFAKLIDTSTKIIKEKTASRGFVSSD